MFNNQHNKMLPNSCFSISNKTDMHLAPLTRLFILKVLQRINFQMCKKQCNIISQKCHHRNVFFQRAWVVKTTPGSSALSTPLQEAGRETPKHRLTEMLCWQKDAWDAENNSMCVWLQEGELCYAVTFKPGLTSGLNPPASEIIPPTRDRKLLFPHPSKNRPDRPPRSSRPPSTVTKTHTHPTRQIRTRAQNSNRRVSLGSLKIIMFNNIV